MADVQLTDQNFEQEVLQAELPVLVDFWATWCGPCRMQAPIVDEVAREFEGRAKVGKLEVEENPKIAQQYGIMSIPTVAVFHGGKIVWQAVGLQQKKNLTDALAKVVPA